MGFLDTVIKDSGNEFASIVSDGVAAGDVTDYVDTGSYILMLFAVDQYMVGYLLIKLLH